jgi:hypothetical protein
LPHKTSRPATFDFALGSDKKGTVSPALFLEKATKPNNRDGVYVGFTRFEAKLCLASNPK